MKAVPQSESANLSQAASPSHRGPEKDRTPDPCPMHMTDSRSRPTQTPLCAWLDTVTRTPPFLGGSFNGSGQDGRTNLPDWEKNPHTKAAH